MAIREITVIGHRALHQPTKKVREVTPELRTLVADLFDTMEAADGVGLAANQVGSRLRVFVYELVDEDGRRHRGHVINPLLTAGELPPGPVDPERDGEGCLSVPGEAFPTKRAQWARVTGTDLTGAQVVVEGTGLLARCLQHETDHLDGRLYVDRLAGAYRKPARQAVKERGWERDGVTKWDPAVQKAEHV